MFTHYAANDRARKINQAIALAMSVVRKGQKPVQKSVPRKADGGGILDDLATNPHGWGSGPAISSAGSSLAAPMWPSRVPGDPMGALTMRDAIGQPDFDIPNAIGSGVASVANAFSPVTAGMDIGEGLGRANSLRDAAPSLAMLAAEATPALGPLGRGLATAMKYAPKSTVGALSLLGATAFPADAGNDANDPLKGLYADRSSLQTQIDQALSTRDSEGQSGKGPKYQAADADVRRLQTQKSALDSMINRKEQENSPEHAQDVAQRQKQIDDANAKAQLDQPFSERHQLASEAMTVGAPLASAALSYFGLRSIAGKGQALVNDLLAAKASGDVGAMADATAKLSQWNNPARLFPKQAASVVLPATLPVDMRTAADVFDKYSLPDTSKAQQNASAKLSNLPQYAKDSGQAALSGLIWSGFGAKGAQIAKAAPRGDANALLSRYGGQSTDDLANLISGEAAASQRTQGPLASLAAAQQARKDGRLDAFGDLGGPAPGPQDREPMPSATSPSSAPMSAASPLEENDLATATSLAPPAERSPALNRALDVAQRQSGMLASSPVFSPDDLASDKASEFLKLFPKEGVTQWRAPDGSIHHRVSEGLPGGGQWTAAPQPKVTKAAKGKGKLSVVSDDDVPTYPGTDIPIKPPKDYDPDDPINRGKANGGLISRAMDVARKYARGGAVIGPIVGATGGRADARNVDVPADSFVWPSDVVAGRGQGNAESGQRFLARIEQHVVQKMGHHALPVRSHKVTGSHVPIRISDGERVTPPEVVCAFGDGDLSLGTRVMNAMVRQFRAQDIQTLKSLPGPSR